MMAEIEPLRVRRRCGHDDILQVQPPWEYVRAVAGQEVCWRCQRIKGTAKAKVDHGADSINLWFFRR
ncbi:hypothetical protein Sulac_2752 [Sulfobacillus acidophilus DSM 10332]|uniref:Uncharacterized protein n=1 Tax=Sulfobacillus acidophilus (strain ATCC 700253 / DSM 10332 / NAL) TaxID=679936 RepID=G8TY07_SULAD|nr:hypothetical protein Sulac_2752 [Sulfobacillus acidophilus DSM 10332]